MTLRRIDQRLSALEDELAGKLECSTCHGSGVDRIYAIPNQDAPWPPHEPCPECGRLSCRQHVVHGVMQADLDALFQPAPPRHVATYLMEN